MITHLGAGVTQGTLLHSVAVWVKNQILTAPLTVKSLQVLIQAVENLTRTITSSQKSSCLLPQFISCLTPTDDEWSCIRQALPPQVLNAFLFLNELEIVAYFDFLMPTCISSQWVKHPLLSGRLRVTGEYPSMDLWKFRPSNRLPVHLCASALLGKIIHTVTSPDDQQVAADVLEISNLKHIGELSLSFILLLAQFDKTHL